jgi:hypothetical protein
MKRPIATFVTGIITVGLLVAFGYLATHRDVDSVPVEHPAPAPVPRPVVQTPVQHNSSDDLTDADVVAFKFEDRYHMLLKTDARAVERCVMAGTVKAAWVAAGREDSVRGWEWVRGAICSLGNESRLSVFGDPKKLSRKDAEYLGLLEGYF